LQKAGPKKQHIFFIFPIFKLKKGFQPRYALGMGFFSLLKIFQSLNLIEPQESIVSKTIELWRRLGESYSKENGLPLIMFSTDSCYGQNSEFCNEETPLNPQSLYAETKAEAEQAVLNENNTLILRYSTGMGVSHVMRVNLLVNDFVYSALKNGKLEVFEPEASRSFINVFDMARAARFFLELLIKKEHKHLIYNVGCDSLNYTKGQLAELISNKTGCKVTNIPGKDTDCRDYKISHDRQYEAGFRPVISMEKTIEDLIRAVPIIEFQRKYQ